MLTQNTVSSDIDIQKVNVQLELVAQLSRKNDLENTLAAYMILKNMKEYENEKPVMGWTGKVATQLTSLLRKEPNLGSCLKTLTQELEQPFKLKSKL
jgi:hypothetical protein